ncbi:hypothetical protein ACFE04_003818 [Oxalis oulophora]
MDLFKIFRDKARRVTWGGMIINHKKFGRHTSTDMGSGHSPSGGFKKAAYFRSLGYIDYLNIMRTPEYNILMPHTSKPQCYDIFVNEKVHTVFGRFFFYGGPGYSARCKT